MSSSVKWALTVYSLIVIGYLAQSIDQHGLGLLRPKIKTEPAFWDYNSHNFLTSEFTSTNSSFMFRGNAQRHGVIDILPAFKGRLEVVLPRFNVGVHLAAKSSPIGNSKMVFVGTDAGWFYAINHQSKAIVWKFYAPAANRGIHSNAVVSAEHVWIGDYAGRLYCFEIDSGRLVWFRQYGHTIGASPLLLNEFLYVNVEVFPANGFLIKVNRRTGEVIWKSEPFGEQSHSSPALSEDEKSIYLGANNSKFFSFNTENGKLNWSINTKEPVKGSPLVWMNKVYFIDQSGTIFVLNSANGEIEYTHAGTAESLSSPSLDKKNSIVYFADARNIYRLKIKDYILTHRDVGGKYSYSSPLFVPAPVNQLVIVCEDQNICLLSADLKKLTRIVKTGYKITSTPFITNGEMWISTNQGPLLVFKGTKQ